MKLKAWALLFWLLFWQAAAMLLNKELFLVSPLQVLQRLAELILTGPFWASVAYSFTRIVGGFLLAFATGIVLAILASKSRVIQALIEPLIRVVKSIPVASFVILSLLWIASRHLSIWIAFLMVLPIAYTHVLEGIGQMDRELLEMAKVFNLSGFKRFRFIYLSEILPYLRSAASLALGLCWKSGIAAEVIGLPDGSIGEHLYQAKIYLDTPDLFAWTVVIVVLSVGFEKLFLLALAGFSRRMEIAA